MKGLGVVLLTFATTTGAAQEKEPASMSLHVTPRVSQSPGTIKATATIERDRRNRQVTIVVESGEYFASSSQSLDGEYSARTHTRRFGDLPVGRYEVRATVVRNDRTTLVAVQIVTIVGARKRGRDAPL